MKINNLDKSNWKQITFGDVAIQQKESVDIETTHLGRYIAGEHMHSEDLHIRQWGVVGDGYLGPAFIRKFQKGDILYGSRRTYLKKVAVADFDGITANTTFVIKANPENIIPELLPFIMLSDSFTEHSIKHSKGSVNPYINWKDIANYKFILPPKKEQARLAELLWVVDEVVEKNLGVKNKLEIVESSLIQKIRKENVEKKYLLGDIINLNYGKALKESDRKNGKYKVVGSAGIAGTHDSFLIKGPGIVVGRKGAAGNVVWVDDNFWPIDTAYWVDLKNSKISLQFAYLLLKSIELNKLMISTAVPGLNRDDALNTSIYLPSPKEQERIVIKFDHLMKTQLKSEKVILRSQQLKSVLINKIF